ncbi:hypothetical protein DBR06_SOUSAS1410041, partial [Sousa chinensis]
MKLAKKIKFTLVLIMDIKVNNRETKQRCKEALLGFPGGAPSGTFFLFFPLETTWKGKCWDLSKARVEDLVPKGILEQTDEATRT